MYVRTAYYVCIIPYCLKLSWDEIFVNFLDRSRNPMWVDIKWLPFILGNLGTKDNCQLLVIIIDNHLWSKMPRCPRISMIFEASLF